MILVRRAARQPSGISFLNDGMHDTAEIIRVRFIPYLTNVFRNQPLSLQLHSVCTSQNSPPKLSIQPRERVGSVISTYLAPRAVEELERW